MKIEIDIDIEAIVREEIRSYIKDNLVINNVSSNPSTVADTVTVTLNEETPTPITTRSRPKSRPRGPRVNWEFSQKPGRRRTTAEIAMHKVERDLGRTLTPEEKGHVRANTEIAESAETQAKEDTLKKAKFDKLAQAGMAAASKELAEEAKISEAPSQGIKENIEPRGEELAAPTSTLFGKAPVEPCVESESAGQPENTTEEATIPKADDLKVLTTLFS